ncbi:MAG: hypothetical protein ACRENE_06580 [Polyangiaceae bacterium]
MSDPPDPKHTERLEPLDERAEEPAESPALRALLKRSLSAEALKDPPDLLAGVQKRIRKRSKGKFFADGWSTSQMRVTYLLIAACTVLLVVLVFLALGPLAVR